MVHRSEHELQWALQRAQPSSLSAPGQPLARQSLKTLKHAKKQPFAHPYHATLQSFDILYHHHYHYHSLPVLTNQLALAQVRCDNEWVTVSRLMLAYVYDLLRVRDKCEEYLALIDQSSLLPSRSDTDSLSIALATGGDSEGVERVVLIVDGWLHTAKYLYRFGRTNLAQSLSKLAYHFLSLLTNDSDSGSASVGASESVRTMTAGMMADYRRLQCAILCDELQFQHSLSLSATLASTITSHHDWRADYDTLVSTMLTMHTKGGSGNSEVLYQQYQLLLQSTINTFQSNPDDRDYRLSAVHSKLTVASTIIQCEMTDSAGDRSINDKFCQSSLALLSDCVKQCSEMVTSAPADTDTETMLVRALVLYGQCQYHYAKCSRNASVTKKSRIAYFQDSIALFDRAAKLVSQQFVTMTSTNANTNAGVSINACSHPLQRRWASIAAMIATVQLSLLSVVEPEPVMEPLSLLAIDTSTVNYQLLVQSNIQDEELKRIERELLSSWEAKYSDVFNDAVFPPLSGLTTQALESASMAQSLHGCDDTTLTLGLAQLALLLQHSERKRLERVTQENLQRRMKEKEVWRKQVYGIDKLEEAQRQAEEEQRRLLEEQREAERLRSEEESRQRAEAEAEAERARLEEEERAAAAAKSKGKGKTAPAPAPAKATKIAAAPSQPLPPPVQQAAQTDCASVEQKAPAEDPMVATFAYDTTEWSPYHLYCWLRETDQQRTEVRGHHREKSLLTGKLRRAPSLNRPVSIDGSDCDDDALDPTILLDTEFDHLSLESLVYQNLFAALSKAVDQHRFATIAQSSLALIKLFTTHRPIVSSKYLALYLSAKVSLRLNEFVDSVSGSDEAIVKRKYNQLVGSDLLVCNAKAKDKCVKWLTGSDDDGPSQSLTQAWSALVWPMQEENDSDSTNDVDNGPLKGYDAIYASMLVTIPFSVSLLTILYEPDDRAIYVSLIASTGFPQSSRFSRTVLTAEQEASLLQCQTFFNQFHTRVQSLLTITPTSSEGDSDSAYQSLESEYVEQLSVFSELLLQPFQRALLTESTLNDRDLILLTDERLFRVPFESLGIFAKCKSICRDFSLSSFYQRLQSSSAEPCNRKNLSVIIHSNTGHTGTGIDSSDLLSEAAAPLVNISSTVVQEKDRQALTRHEYLQSFVSAKDSGAIVDFGYSQLVSTRAIASEVSGVDLRGVRLAVLMAQTLAVTLPGTSSACTSNIDSPLSTYLYSLLLSCRGINTLLISDHCQSECVNATQIKLVSLSLSSGQSIASCLKQIQACTEVVPSVSFAISRTQSPIGSRASSRVGSPRNKATKGGLFSPSRAVKSSRYGAQPVAGLVSSVIRTYDRFNSVIVGLPHWRL